ncbi:MAG: ABC transporter permease [Actinobacteria bacterium]|nr:ABC transporter permease [Actinomycetota bacterium]
MAQKGSTDSARGAHDPSALGGSSPSEWRLVWRRFRRDRVAFVALLTLCAVVAACFVAEPALEVLLGHDGSQPIPAAVDVNLNPAGPFTRVAYTAPDGSAHQALLLLGADGPLGRDELLRLLAGGRVSLEIAFIASAIALFLGVILGAIAGYFGGVADAIVSRLTELLMSFPLLLLMIALGQTVAARFENVTLHGLLQPGVAGLGLIVGIFCWFYPARLVRALVASLKEQEFVEAARMIGASDARIIRQHLAPHVTGPLIVWGTLVASGVIILEASLSVLNFGVRLGTASWGNLLASNWGTLLVFDPGAADGGIYPKPPLLMVWPALILFVTVLSLALAGDGLRSALSPKEGV